jgi:hypothetical protein
MPEVVEFIVPELIDIAEVMAAIDGGLEDGAKVVESDMKKVTASWRNKPKWERDGPMTIGGDRVLDYAVTDPPSRDNPFPWVDAGTKGPYPIPKAGPHPTGLGPFQTGYIRKSPPFTFASGPGGRFGKFIRPKRVMHPGIEQGGYTDLSAENLKGTLPNMIQFQLNAVKSL